MNLEQTQKFRSILQRDIDVLTKRLESLNKDKTRSRGPLSADFADQAQETENDQVVDHLESIELKQLASVQNALQRLDHGSFGTCLECGEPISKARLEAIPYTEKCIKCTD